MKRIKTENGETFAHLLGKGTIEIKRQKQKFIVTGSDFQIIGTEPNQNRKMVVSVEDSVLLEDDILLEDDDNLTDEERKAMQQQKDESQQNPLETEEDALNPKQDPEKIDGEEQE